MSGEQKDRSSTLLEALLHAAEAADATGVTVLLAQLREVGFDPDGLETADALAAEGQFDGVLQWAGERLFSGSPFGDDDVDVDLDSAFLDLEDTGFREPEPAVAADDLLADLAALDEAPAIEVLDDSGSIDALDDDAVLLDDVVDEIAEEAASEGSQPARPHVLSGRFNIVKSGAAAAAGDDAATGDDAAVEADQSEEEGAAAQAADDEAASEEEAPAEEAAAEGEAPEEAAAEEDEAAGEDEAAEEDDAADEEEAADEAPEEDEAAGEDEAAEEDEAAGEEAAGEDEAAEEDEAADEEEAADEAPEEEDAAGEEEAPEDAAEEEEAAEEEAAAEEEEAPGEEEAPDDAAEEEAAAEDEPAAEAAEDDAAADEGAPDEEEGAASAEEEAPEGEDDVADEEEDAAAAEEDAAEEADGQAEEQDESPEEDAGAAEAADVDQPTMNALLEALGQAAAAPPERLDPNRETRPNLSPTPGRFELSPSTGFDFGFDDEDLGTATPAPTPARPKGDAARTRPGPDDDDAPATRDRDMTPAKPLPALDPEDMFFALAADSDISEATVGPNPAARTNPFAIDAPTGVAHNPLSASVVGPAESVVPTNLNAILLEARRLRATGELDAALDIAKKVLSRGENEDAEALRDQIEAELVPRRIERIGSLDRTPRVKLKGKDISGLDLDHRAGFVISQVDGMMTFEDLLELSSMSRFETLTVICDLLDHGVIEAD